METVFEFIRKLLITLPILVVSLTLHEYAHGRVALALGDETAKRAGRLTLNPISHFEPIGVLVFILSKFTFGWAKPVPVDFTYMRNFRQGLILVSLAGPITNLILALIAATGLKLIVMAGEGSVFYPLGEPLLYMVFINTALAVFNFLPIPPLDGSKVMYGLLPPNLASKAMELEPWGIVFILVLFIAGAPFIGRLIYGAAGLILALFGLHL